MFKQLLFVALIYVGVVLAEFHDDLETSRVVGGSPAKYPFIVLFKWRDNSNFCSGSLVKSNKVLTSAWCALKMKGYVVSAVLNTRSPTPDSDAIRRKVASFIIYPAQPSYNSQTIMDDLAIVTLDSPVTVVPISIGYTVNLNGLTGVAIGWGSNMNPGVSSVLQSANVAVVPPATCGTYFGNAYYSSGDYSICLQANGVASCTVDAGGPIISQSGYLIGVSSYADCNLGRPIVAVRLQKYQKWLQYYI